MKITRIIFMFFVFVFFNYINMYSAYKRDKSKNNNKNKPTQPISQQSPQPAPQQSQILSSQPVQIDQTSQQIEQQTQEMIDKALSQVKTPEEKQQIMGMKERIETWLKDPENLKSVGINAAKISAFLVGNFISFTTFRVFELLIIHFVQGGTLTDFDLMNKISDSAREVADMFLLKEARQGVKDAAQVLYGYVTSEYSKQKGLISELEKKAMNLNGEIMKFSSNLPEVKTNKYDQEEQIKNLKTRIKEFKNEKEQLLTQVSALEKKISINNKWVLPGKFVVK